MRVHVVSDVHGSVEALARAGDGADALVVLGDLIEFVDYHDPTAGIIGRALGPRVSAEFGRLRAGGAPGELVRFITDAWSRLPDAAAVVEQAIREQYDRLFAALTAPTYAIPGNVDLPRLWPEYARPGLCLPDGRVVTIGGLRFGFVGGVPLPPGRTPRARRAVDAARAGRRGVRRRGARADGGRRAVQPRPARGARSWRSTCVTRRPEAAAPALLELVRRDRPRAALFGHVHQPLAARVRVGRTECVNVGHFRETGRPYVLRW